MEASELVAHWNTPPPHTFQAWPSLKSYARASGQASMSTTSTEASRRSETESDLISGILPNASIYGSSNTPSQKSLSAKIEAKACCHLLDPSSQEHHRQAHFCLIAFLEPERGFSPFRTPSSPTFLLPYFGSAFAVAFACPSGPRTRTARSADRSWTNGATTPWFADAAATLLPVTI